MKAEESLEKLFTETFGSAPAAVTPLAGAGSNRRYFRLENSCLGDETGSPKSIVGTCGTDIAENRAFIYLANHFSAKGLPVPQVLASTPDDTVYIQQDLGNESLFSILNRTRLDNGDFTHSTEILLEKCMTMLPHIQLTGAEGIDFSKCYPQAELTSDQIRWDLNYFKYNFLKIAGIEFDEVALENDFSRLHTILWSRTEHCTTFMVRDFQSRNIMIADGAPFLIDFQGGRRGPMEYDVASFLWQSRARIPQQLRSRLIDAYVNETSALASDFNEMAFREALPAFVLFRSLQTLGTYGFRGLTERKPQFISSIPNAIETIGNVLHENNLSETFPAISEAIERAKHSALVRDLRMLTSVPAFDGLTVTITSFSYRKGIPVDLSGNGGGFVFDCRAIHNPGRYEPYKLLTGRDEPVKKFLEDDGEIFNFLSHVFSLTDASVERYLKRGFTSLCVNFGCTGGQHRSVYSAEATARHIASQYPAVRVILWHKEQNIFEIIPSFHK